MRPLRGSTSFVLLLLLAFVGLGEVTQALIIEYQEGGITVHKFPAGTIWGGRVMTDDPTILHLPPAWDCYKEGPNHPTTTARVFDTLSPAGGRVWCTPPDGAMNCLDVMALGYASKLVGGRVTVTAECGNLLATARFGPTGSDRQTDSGLGFDNMPLLCDIDWEQADTTDDWWVHCHVNVPPNP